MGKFVWCGPPQQSKKKQLSSEEGSPEVPLRPMQMQLPPSPPLGDAASAALSFFVKVLLPLLWCCFLPLLLGLFSSSFGWWCRSHFENERKLEIQNEKITQMKSY